MAAGGVMAGSVASEYPSAAEVARGAEEEEELATAEEENKQLTAEVKAATTGIIRCFLFCLVHSAPWILELAKLKACPTDVQLRKDITQVTEAV